MKLELSLEEVKTILDFFDDTYVHYDNQEMKEVLKRLAYFYKAMMNQKREGG